MRVFLGVSKKNERKLAGLRDKSGLSVAFSWRVGGALWAMALEPHLHFHLQDPPDPYHDISLPVAFSDLTIGNQSAVRARLQSGHQVKSIL